MTEASSQPAETSNLSKEQLSKLALFLTATIHELNAGLQESAGELTEEGVSSSPDALRKHVQILAAISGASLSVALIMGVSSEEFGALCQQLTMKIMAEFDTMQETVTH